MEKFKPNLEYFALPKSNFINNLVLSKYDFLPIELNSKTPCIYLTQKTDSIDKNLIRKCIISNFVFIKDDIISKISNGELKEKEQKKLLNEINLLAKNNYSISIIYGTSPTIFGKNELLSESFIEFLKNTNLDIKFLTFPGEYFSSPIWADKPRRSKIVTSQQVTIKQRFLEGLKQDEIISYFQNSIPASASTYLSKYPITIHSNNLASGIERIMYCCPHCKKLFSIYSEFSCVKCRECGMVVEFSPDGTILFSNELSSFDDIEDFQFNNLIKNDLTINQLVEYKNVIQVFYENCKKPIKINVILQLYAEKMIIINNLTKKQTTVEFEDIEFIEYLKNNTIKFKTKNAKQFCFIGNSNENFFIIKDLVKLNKN